MIKVCFLGTPEFAAVHLRALLNETTFSIVGVVTQPDRPAGRKMQLTPSAVKSAALENNLPILTPENLRKQPEIFEQIKKWNPDIAVVVAFGQILNQDFLDYFKFGAVNVHGSLLPRWRGAAPIQRSIQAGDLETGVSLQKIVKKLDAGPIIGERKVKLENQTTATELYNQLAVLGCELLKIELPKYISGKINLTIQDESQVTIATKIEKEESLLKWENTAAEIHNKVRAFSMGPGTYCLFQNKRLKIIKTKIVDPDSKGKPGYIKNTDQENLVLQTGSGSLALLEVQPESKAKIPIKDFLNIYKLKNGDAF